MGEAEAEAKAEAKAAEVVAMDLDVSKGAVVQSEPVEQALRRPSAGAGELLES